MGLETLFWSCMIVAAFIVPPVWVSWHNRDRIPWLFQWETALGLILLDDDLIESVRRRVHAAVEATPVHGIRNREEAEKKLRKAAIRAIVAAFQERNPKQRQTPTWPQVTITLSQGEAICKLWLGHDYAAKEGIEPVRVSVNWGQAVTPTTRTPQEKPAATAKTASTSSALAMLARKGTRQ